jgi:hypothetical protein
MGASQPSLPPEIEAAVAQHHGGPEFVPGEHGKYVVMNADVYSDQMAGATSAEYADSIAAVRRSLAQAAADELEDAEVFFGQLEQKYEVQGTADTAGESVVDV